MLFPEEDAPVLKQWIVKRLENTYVAFRIALSFSAGTYELNISGGIDIGRMRTPTCSPTMLWHCCDTRGEAMLCENYWNPKFLIF